MAERLSTSQPGLFDLPTRPIELADGTRQQQATKKSPRREKATATDMQQSRKPTTAPQSTAGKKGRQKKGAPRATSGLVPAGDVRLTANIKAEIHLTLKIVSAHRRTTIGELIEELVENHLESPYGIKKRFNKF